MSNDSNSLVENQAQTEYLKRFYEFLAGGQYAKALEIADIHADFNGESERIVITALRLKLGLQKYIG
jgi:hypothetical protein